MLRLKNIEIKNNRAEADFYPEDSKTCGHVVVDISSGELTSVVEVSGYGASYSGHARQRLVRMAKEHDTRAECLVMWY